MSLVNTAIGRIFAAGMSDDVLADLLANGPVRLAGRAAAPVDAAFRARLATIRADELDFAFDAPVPGIGTVAAPVFDHTGSIRLVIAIIGSSRGFPRGPDSDLAQALLAATRRLSWRFGWIGG